MKTDRPIIFGLHWIYRSNKRKYYADYLGKENLIQCASLDVVRTPEAERDLRAIDSAVNAFEQKLDIAEQQQLARHPFLAGDAFSLADVQFGHVLYRYYDIGIKRKPLPHLRAYYAKLTQRPAFQEHVMVSYDELRA